MDEYFQTHRIAKPCILQHEDAETSPAQALDLQDENALPVPGWLTLYF